MRKTLIAGAAMLFLSPASLAQTATWKPDPMHSQVTFSISHMVIAEVTGRFKEFDVTLEQSKDDFAGGRLTATVKTASVDTDNEKRDEHVRTEDFFNVEKYPEMKFKSTSIEKTGKDTYRIQGDLTIRDVTKPVVLETTHNGTIKDPWGNTRAGFTATTTIKRLDYGLKWSKTLDTGGLIAGNEVEVKILVSLVKSM